MMHRRRAEIPNDLRTRLETARLDLLALFRALDRLFFLAPLLLGVPQRVSRARGASRHRSGRQFQHLRRTDPPVEGEVANRFRIGAALTARVRIVRRRTFR